MKRDDLSWPRVFWVLAIAVSSGWFVGLSPRYLEYRERGVYDILQARHESFRPRYSLILVSTGNRSARALQQLSQPRLLHAQVLDRLSQARFVVLDVPLTEASLNEQGSIPAEGAGNEFVSEDTFLAEAIRRHGRVGGSVYLIPSPQGDAIQEPLPEFYDAFKRVGIANLTEDTDGVYRRGIWGAEAAGKFIPSLPMVALEELCERSFPYVERNRHLEVRLPWKNMNLYRSSPGFIEFWLNWTRYEIPVYEYIDVLNGKVPEATFQNALVVIDNPSRTVVAPTRRTVSEGETILRSVASLLSPFVLHRVNATWRAILTMILAACGAVAGFVHFRRSFAFLSLLFLSYTSGAVALFLREGLWLPTVAPIAAASCGYLGSQAILSWYLYTEWNVRSLSIKPLLALAQRADTDLSRGMNFDEYLRSLWNDIEEKTGVILKSTRLNENFSLVQSYLQRAQSTPQQGQENFYIIKNASDAPPRHRMLLPLPLWNDRGDKAPTREYVILAWNGNIPTETLTSLAALTLFAAVHFHALEEGRRRKEMLFKTIEAIMMAVEAKDPTTSEHSRRVANLSKQLAQWMNLTPQEIEDVYFSAIIHDIGKLGISDSILKKPSMLTKEEVAEMQRHPSIGEDIMRPVDLPEYIVSGIAQHHERHDGKGYPSGIKGDRMTTAGKIIKVADVFDALANRRQYKEAWTPQQVRGFLLERRGTEFDPRIVDIFLKHLPQ
ncbi:MAG: CHASE2 domain-containing protein [Synergistaceae bacterium]|nr:CHASE2 domain-containing protein [Synergistaceae bacterium]